METRDFLSAVLPSSGYYCVAEFTSKKKEHVFVQSLAEVEEHAHRLDAQKKDTYYALATFNEAGDRTAPNAVLMRSFFIDLDVSTNPAKGDKVYASRQEAITALDAFLTETELGLLGRPWIVSSGGGLHAYWPLTEDVSITKWRPAAEAFKRLCAKHSLRIDHTVTADAARVLRIPGTHNYKLLDKPRRVKLAIEGDTFTFDTFVGALKDKLNGEYHVPHAATPISLPGQRPAAATGSTLKLFDNTETRFKDILTQTAAGGGCRQLAHYIDNAADDGMEPIWRGMLSITTKCVDGAKAATWLSSLHPYPVQRMRTKLAEIKGPYPCTKFDSEAPGVCRTCKHWGKITNPLALGRSLVTDNTEKEIVLPEAVAAKASLPIQVMRPTPPLGYSYGRAGGVFKDVMEPDEDGVMVKVQKLILPYDLFVVDILQSPDGAHTIHMLAMRPSGAVQITLPQRSIVTKDDTCKALAEQNVVASIGSGNDKNLFEYVRTCVEEASVTKRAVRVPAAYGWQPDDTFVFNERIFAPGVPSRVVPMLELGNINKSTKPAGTLAAWRRVTALMISRGMFDVVAMSLVGFGAPLMRFTGFYGMTFHIGSTQSGTGKTLALELAASVWGHPVHYRVGKKTSDVAMQQRLGMLNSLPLVCDEITDKNRKDFEWFPSFLFDMTEGRGKERMEAGANKERLNLSTWQTLALMSSNTHVVDYLTGARKHSSEGELRRMLEMTMETPLTWPAHEIDTLKTLHDNYGVAGEVFAQWVVDHPDEAQDIVTQTQAGLYKEFDATNDERFWVAGLAAMVAGAVIAGKAGIINYPLKAIVAVLKSLIERARLNVRTSVRNAEDVLNAYTRENYGRFVVIRALSGTLTATLGESGAIDQTITRSEIAGRVEHNVRPGFVEYFIEEQLLKQYCSSMSFGYADFRAQLERMHDVTYGKKDMMSRTRGPQMRVNAMCITRPIEEFNEEAFMGKVSMG